MLRGMIPCIGTAIYNRPDLLQGMASSVDYPVDVMIVVNNGQLNLPVLFNTHIDRYDTVVPSGNLGVAGAWNCILDKTFNEYQKDAVLIVGTDIIWHPGDLQLLWQTCLDFPDADFVFGNHSYSNFMVKRSGWEKVGPFCELFYPAYLEDSCHFQVVRRHPDVKAIHAAGLRATHEGSATINSDPALKAQVKAAQEKGWRIYSEMWGCPMWSGGAETFSTPYNHGGPLNEWELDAEQLKRPHYFPRWPLA